MGQSQGMEKSFASQLHRWGTEMTAQQGWSSSRAGPCAGDLPHVSSLSSVPPQCLTSQRRPWSFRVAGVWPRRTQLRQGPVPSGPTKIPMSPSLFLWKMRMSVFPGGPSKVTSRLTGNLKRHPWLCSRCSSTGDGHRPPRQWLVQETLLSFRMLSADSSRVSDSM